MFLPSKGHAKGHVSGDEKTKQKIYESYLKHFEYVNNWDLLDMSAYNIVGEYLLKKSKDPLFVWAKDPNLWMRRLAMVSTLAFIRKGEFAETLAIAEMLLNDKEDLIHKAVGWMLREMGKRDQKVLESFLDKYSSKMPRTALRYACERLPKNLARSYLIN